MFCVVVYGWGGSLWPQLSFSASDLIIYSQAVFWGRIQWGEKALTWIGQTNEGNHGLWGVLSLTRVPVCLVTHRTSCFLFIYLTNYIKLYWVPMACTKMKKIMLLSFRRSQSVGENHHGTMEVVHSVWIKYPRSNVLTLFPRWGQRVLYSFACFIKFYFSDK